MIDAFIVGAVLAVALTVLVLFLQMHAKGQSKKALATLEDFNESQSYFDSNGHGIAIDEGRERICLIKGNRNLKVVTYDKIIACEVLEDGGSILSTARGSQVLGAAVGGAVFGAAGAIVGGLSGKKNSADTCFSISLKLVIDDTENPVHQILFYSNSSKNKGVSKSGIVYKTLIQQARHWHGIMDVAIKRAESKRHAQPKQNSPGSLADEIMKLNELRLQGVLTEEEFASSKSKLLKDRDESMTL